MKKIIVDARCIFDSGIGVYIKEMLLVLSNRKHIVIEIVLLPSQLSRFNTLDLKVQKIHCVNFTRFSWRNLFFMKKIVTKDVIYFMPALAIPPLNFKGRCITTVHDVCPVKMRRFFGAMTALLYWLMLLFQIIISDRVFAISKFTMTEMATLYPSYLMKKVRVIYNGVSRRLNARESQTDGINHRPRPYLLCVGNIKPHKNVINFVDFFSSKSKLSCEYDLVIVGQSEGFKTGENLNKNFPPSIVFTGFVSDEALAKLYANAKAFIYPSLYEGFGLPLFEAMLFGLPIMASNIDIFNELAGDAVFYFDPYSFEDFDLNFTVLLKSKRDELPYDKILSSFSWDKSVDEFLKEIYQ
ncbi:glycosyltransferase family 4 protein [Aeromonas veronii]|uniref:glycosyltransferase family 4 protein n=1 Tax=Aeromonas veronii TaxID=654 RepID=UPI00191FF3CF|nr:glycosyltransferase family 1 protein [Aeromonas veronii]MBL0443732.1 glycosyltransferase family 4 protein [Aeromonas veronii]